MVETGRHCGRTDNERMAASKTAEERTRRRERENNQCGGRKTRRRMGPVKVQSGAGGLRDRPVR